MEDRVRDAGSGTETSVTGRRHRRRSDRGHAGDSGGGFRADVEGLRAVAVLLVLLFHAGVPGVPGGFIGVDVFFVISGFLITGLLVSELEKRNTISLTRFYARRAKRLLPAAAVVLVTTTLLVWAFTPRHRWDATGGDVMAAALYVVNWRFADRSVDYLAEGIAPSPVQHFWSLAVEEQFYLVWPLLMLVAALLGRRRGRPRVALGAALAAVAIPSFAFSIQYTSSSPEKAFFVSTTRMWELAVGAAVAVGTLLLARMPKALGLGLGWVGVATIVASGVAVTHDVAWPGWAAAVPVLGTAAVLAGGFTAGARGPVAVLGTRPFRWVGGLSYSLYLWHWPLLVVARDYFNGLSLSGALLIVALSFVPAWLTQRLVENPLRFSRRVSRSPRLALGLGANFTAVGAAAGLVLVLAVGATTPAAPVRGQVLGAATLTSSSGQAAAAVPADIVEGGITPDPAVADKDVPDIYSLGCQQDQRSAEPVRCQFGPATTSNPTTIAVVGDSKAGQWLPALQLLANANHWRVVTYTKSHCPLVDAETFLAGKPYTSCQEWSRNVLQLLTGPEKPDFVLTSQNPSRATGRNGKATFGAMQDALASTWARLADAGIEVLALADNPHPDKEVWQCVSEHVKQLSKCAFDRTLGVQTSAAGLQKAAVRQAGGRIVQAATSGPTMASVAKDSTGRRPPVYLDLVDSICPAVRCAPVIGHVLVYRQAAHLTATYVATLAPRLGALLRAAGVPSAATAPGRATVQALDAVPAPAQTLDKPTGVSAAKAPEQLPQKSAPAAVPRSPVATKPTGTPVVTAATPTPGQAAATAADAAAKRAAATAAKKKADQKKADAKKAAAKKAADKAAAQKAADQAAADRAAQDATAAPAANEPATKPNAPTPAPAPTKPSPLGGLLPPPKPAAAPASR
jgi:peptidoglycan/LPS O-acetylase OafA/YrhL